MSLSPNGQLFEYRIERLIGQGAFGSVWLAYDTLLERPVAIKELTPTARTDETAFRRFLQEARTAGNLNSAHIVTVYALKVQEPNVYLVAEYLGGGNVRDMLEERGRLPVQQAVQIAADVCEGLVAAHARGIVHRDIKPENVLLTEDGRAKVGDFGIAHVPRGASRSWLTQTGAQPGTLVYMSPEQIRGRPLDGSSDVYQVGALLYEMLAGHHYIRFGELQGLARQAAGSNLMKLQARLCQLLDRAICEQKPEHLRQIRPAVPEWVAKATHAALEKGPEKRPTALALKKGLGEGMSLATRADLGAHPAVQSSSTPPTASLPSVQDPPVGNSAPVSPEITHPQNHLAPWVWIVGGSLLAMALVVFFGYIAMVDPMRGLSLKHKSTVKPTPEPTEEMKSTVTLPPVSAQALRGSSDTPKHQMTPTPPPSPTEESSFTPLPSPSPTKAATGTPVPSPRPTKEATATSVPTAPPHTAVPAESLAPITSDGWRFSYRGPVTTLEYFDVGLPQYPANGQFRVIPIVIEYQGEGPKVLSLAPMLGPANGAAGLRLVDATGREYVYDWKVTSDYLRQQSASTAYSYLMDSRQRRTHIVQCVFDVPPDIIAKRIDVYEGPMYSKPRDFVGSIALP